MSSQLIINPVGRVRAEKGHFQLIIKPHFKDALTELAGFSHIQILWWGHKTDTPEWCSGWPQWQEDSGAFDWASVFNF